MRAAPTVFTSQVCHICVPTRPSDPYLHGEQLSLAAHDGAVASQLCPAGFYVFWETQFNR